MPQPPSLVFLDLETEGLDPDRHRVLEVGLLIADPQTLTVRAEFSAPVRTLDACVGADPYVIDMHTRSGLLDACVAAPLRLADVERAACEFLRRCDALGQPLCGANPSFDRSFLRAYAPTLERAFHYRNLDVNSCWLIDSLCLGGPSAKADVAHRALADCHQALAALRSYVERLRRAG